ncbi:hypothetical protein [Lysobacter sp. Root667]|uniref:hypothetical protein n=1 Tax=Lysobacter sp. Root667 TaxID=1736581 RepID=UPI0012DD3EBA|nr:hypothetical protein [Lysobacter sp. Root667]
MSISIPIVLTERPEFESLSQEGADAFAQRLRAISEIAMELAADDRSISSRSFLDIINDVELDISIHQEYRSPEFSRWLVHSSWVFEVAAANMAKELDADLLSFIDRPEPGMMARAEECFEWLKIASKTVLNALDKFQNSISSIQCFCFLLVVDIVFSKMLVVCYKSRFNAAVDTRD